ncbi:hypothetical protein L593_12540 [Salinarchaeum sp. Harcht-Bsk1]|uniref:hypothetical protein n=1 Tax=Salinarchaeum sp. Harcht-Bsk1 TaxID=1333523 RepID=UPI0003424925|nr:hypothetical protein [Salinarchaeum sp. Harcht-Bsk1]AGN02447.1 hypothetical protein L593_12540 [Salinarchaeum sp. Harcht-Bsk1]
MSASGSTLGQIAGNLLAAALMIVLAVLTFFITVFVVDAGASLAGYDDNAFVVLSAAVLAGSAIIAGGIAPIGAVDASVSVGGFGGEEKRDPLE